MQTLKPNLFFVLTFFLWPLIPYAQPDPSADVNPFREKFQYYTGFKVSGNARRFSGAAEYLYRTRQQLNGMEGSFFYAHIRYKVNRHFAPEFKFRYVTTYTRDHYRYELALRFSYKYKKLNFLYRPAFFYEYEYLARQYEPGHQPTYYLRNRIQLSVNFSKKFDPFISAEAYSRITSKHTEIRRMAYIAGGQLKLSKQLNLILYYLLQPEYNQQNPKMVHAVGTTLELTFQQAKKKKNKKEDYF